MIHNELKFKKKKNYDKNKILIQLKERKLNEQTKPRRRRRRWIEIRMKAK